MNEQFAKILFQNQMHLCVNSLKYMLLEKIYEEIRSDTFSQRIAKMFKKCEGFNGSNSHHRQCKAPVFQN